MHAVLLLIQILLYRAQLWYKKFKFWAQKFSNNSQFLISFFSAPPPLWEQKNLFFVIFKTRACNSKRWRKSHLNFCFKSCKFEYKFMYIFLLKINMNHPFHFSYWGINELWKTNIVVGVENFLHLNLSPMHKLFFLQKPLKYWNVSDRP